MEYLIGGRVDQIIRQGETVYRPAGAWTPTVHKLLHYIRAQGFLGVPEPRGFDNAGNEMVSFIPGEISNYPLSETAVSQEALISSAQLLRDYHDASASFFRELQGNEVWMLPPREPAEVICHGDYAPYNVVLQGKKAVAIIDFDTAHPAPRVWDIAYALYRWAPLTHPDNQDGFGSEREKIERAHLFCDVYGLTKASRVGLTSLVVERLQVLVDFMFAEAAHGNEAFKANIADGHHLVYLKDIDYLQTHVKEL
ncbi:MAG: aminoglycoside phosphotransferase family protein [Anaerolineae bacterium]|nr:aminoglycoside phosphotransferase family protein [Anaerolineae bacterium]